MGHFITTKPLKLLDLAGLPPVPGIFSTADRDQILIARFLHHFAHLVAAPVERTDRNAIDYVPTQVFTEYLRDHEFSFGRLDGIRYPTSRKKFSQKGRYANVVLFVTRRLLRSDDSPLALESVSHYPLKKR